MVTRRATKPTADGFGANLSPYPAIEEAAARLADEYTRRLLAALREREVDLTSVTGIEVAYEIELRSVPGKDEPLAAPQLSTLCIKRTGPDGQVIYEPPGCGP